MLVWRENVNCVRETFVETGLYKWMCDNVLEESQYYEEFHCF
jgi:hypothetical protein